MIPGFLNWSPTEGLLALGIAQSRWVHLVGRHSARTLQTFRAILSVRRGLRNPLVPEFLWHLHYDPFTGYLVLFWVCKGQINFGVTNSAATVKVFKLLTFLLVHPPYRLLSCVVPPPQIKCQEVVSPTPSACCFPASMWTTVLPGNIPKLPHAACTLCPTPSPTSPLCALQVHRCHASYGNYQLSHLRGHRAETLTGTHPSCSLLCPDVWQTAYA